MIFSAKFSKFLIVLTLCVMGVASVVFAQSGRRTLAELKALTGTKFIALTFDDGPNETWTPQVLDELERLGAKATFYVQGQKITPATKHIIERMTREGHDVDNHSYDHPSFGLLLDGVPQITTIEDTRENLRKASQAIFDAAGYWPFSFRAPFLEWGDWGKPTDLLAGLDREMAMAFVDARIDPKDYDNQGAPQTIANYISGLADSGPAGEYAFYANGGIILLHDCGGPDRSGTVASLELFIPQMQARGYEFVTVRELFMLNNTSPELFLCPAWKRGSLMSPRVNQMGLPVWRPWDVTPERLWDDDWATKDWWSCATPPWERNGGADPCGATSVIPQSSNNAKRTTSGLQINGLNAGVLSLNVANAGMYNISIHSIDGRVLAQTSANLVAGVNSLTFEQNLAKGVAIVRVQGANTSSVRRISIR